ncbi:adenylyltransferase/cytidyltransferase family protein [Patescibacteria group bacterium]|nr:adenylyltransferase/cytidyltransferase family protein [Patescibacteria group bacterium]
MKKTSLTIPYSKAKDYQNVFKNKKTVLVGGCFDLVHYGHLRFLKKAKESGDYLIVVLESDKFIKKNKRETPIHNQKERAEVLSNLNFVDMVVMLPYFSSNKEYYEMIKTIKPKIVAVTDGDPQFKNKKKQIGEVGGKLKVVTPLLKKFSTRKIISKFS